MQKKYRLGLLFGGQSPEHNVSVQSAYSIARNCDPNKYEVIPIGIDRRGGWHFFDFSTFCEFVKRGHALEDAPCINGQLFKKAFPFDPSNLREVIDVLFPALHGRNGEDGTVQGLAALAGIPFVGPDVTGSAICMDKEVMKRVLQSAGLPIAKFEVCRSINDVNPETLREKLSLPLFVKPTHTGSSIGVSKVHKPEEVLSAAENAFQYAEKVLFEETISGKELNCSVLGGRNPYVSPPGELLFEEEYISFDIRYKPGAINLRCPADLPPDQIDEVKEIVSKAFSVLQCEGMARVDLLVRAKDQKVFINEVNTIPGFTKDSYYPKLLEMGGISYRAMIDHLVEYAFARFARWKKIDAIEYPNLVK